MLLISYKTLFWFLRYSIFCNFLSLVQCFKIKKEVENEKNMTPWIIFGITQLSNTASSRITSHFPTLALPLESTKLIPYFGGSLHSNSFCIGSPNSHWLFFGSTTPCQSTCNSHVHLDHQIKLCGSACM